MATPLLARSVIRLRDRSVSPRSILTAGLATVKRAVVGSRVRTIHECRRCGTTVDAGIEECPACASTRIARYEIR